MFIYSLTVSISEGDKERRFDVKTPLSLGALEDTISQVIEVKANAIGFVFSIQQHISILPPR